MVASGSEVVDGVAAEVAATAGVVDILDPVETATCNSDDQLRHDVQKRGICALKRAWAANMEVRENTRGYE